MRGMLPMFDGHDLRWRKGKPLMKLLFDVPGNQPMSDVEFAACQKFIDDTFKVSEWPRDNFQRACEFLRMVRKSYEGSTDLGHNVPWRVLKAKYDRDNMLPSFREINDDCCIAFFTIDLLNQRTQCTECIEFTDAFVRSIR